MTDIISTVPYQCGDKDCTSPGTWHKGNYWQDDEDGYTYDAYSDGDHEVVDKTELPTPEEEVKAWAEYRLWAVEHQLDPLSEFMGGIPRNTIQQTQT